MGWGLYGFRCRGCRLNFNSFWSSHTPEFGGGECPECGSADTERLPYSVKTWNRDEIPDYDPEFDGAIPATPSWKPPDRRADDE